jgi:hypothetical protein
LGSGGEEYENGEVILFYKVKVNEKSSSRVIMLPNIEF